MNYEQAERIIKSLSRCQGFYGRLYLSMQEWDEYQKEQFCNGIKDCKDDIDLILLLES